MEKLVMHSTSAMLWISVSHSKIAIKKCKAIFNSSSYVKISGNDILEDKSPIAFHRIKGALDNILKMDMPILTCTFFTFNWLILTSEMHFVKFHPDVASCLLLRGKRKYAPLGMRLLWKYIRNYFLVYHLISHILLYLQNYKEF